MVVCVCVLGVKLCGGVFLPYYPQGIVRQNTEMGGHRRVALIKWGGTLIMVGSFSQPITRLIL